MARMTGEHLQAIRTRHGRGPRTFVETGTYEGKSTRLALQQFATVHTIELEPGRVRAARRTLAPLGAHVHQGDSRTWVKRLARSLDEPVCWYLDAHWFDVPGVARGPLPLWDELAALCTREWADIVVVDDVHDFGTDRPTPEWRAVSLDRIAEQFPAVREAVILGDQAVVYL